MPLTIRRDDLGGAAIRALLEEHLRHMRSVSPPESVHALDLAGLQRPEITLWAAWDGATLAGCGALKALDATHGEIKSMRAARAYRGRGVGKALLSHIITEARRRGYLRLSLESGTEESFAPAHKLYASHGFVACAPFAGYREDPNSIFMTRTL